nr:hypothetical protein [Tanacetum cinerariifolium]
WVSVRGGSKRRLGLGTANVVGGHCGGCMVVVVAMGVLWWSYDGGEGVIGIGVKVGVWVSVRGRSKRRLGLGMANVVGGHCGGCMVVVVAMGVLWWSYDGGAGSGIWQQWWLR